MSEITAYTTRWALSKGVIEIRGAERKSGLFYGHRVGGSSLWNDYFNASEWHRTKQGASVVAEIKRVAAIAAAEKKIKRLKALRFDAGDE